MDVPNQSLHFQNWSRFIKIKKDSPKQKPTIHCSKSKRIYMYFEDSSKWKFTLNFLKSKRMLSVSCAGFKMQKITKPKKQPAKSKAKQKVNYCAMWKLLLSIMYLWRGPFTDTFFPNTSHNDFARVFPFQNSKWWKTV